MATKHNLKKQVDVTPAKATLKTSVGSKKSNLNPTRGFQVASWNVNGLRSVYTKNALAKWLESTEFDLVMLQEVKATPELYKEIPELKGFKGFQFDTWATSAKAGYAGCLTLSKLEPERTQVGLGDSAFDQEGRWVEVQFGEWIFINSYFPNSQRDHARLPFKLRFCEVATERLEKLRSQKFNVILGGDINVAHTEIDLANPKTNKDNAGFLPEERDWMTRFLERGWLDTFRVFNTSAGQYTWWSYRPGVREKNIGWRLDHFFLNEEAKPHLIDVRHEPKVMGSDHCPIVVQLNALSPNR